MRVNCEVVGAVVAVVIAFTSVVPGKCTCRKHIDQCGHNLGPPSGFFKRHIDFPFLKKFFKHCIPFRRSARVKMQFYLFKRDFPECGREISVDDDEMLDASGFDGAHPTRIIIHGWMSQSKGSFNRAVKNAYLRLATSSGRPNITTANENISPIEKGKSSDSYSADFNVIVVDWSIISSNVNYFGVVDLIEDLGFLLVELVRYLHIQAQLDFDNVYLIGHSIGAQIAGSAGKQIQPFKFNTIFALDPAGPKFRETSEEFRIDSSDATYVESIQTSNTLGFEKPLGHATFYPNYGKDQKKCYIFGCSHSRAYDYFAESIYSKLGFWGTPCQRSSDKGWSFNDSAGEFRMGGEPSIPKRGTFYVKMNDTPPYALGKTVSQVFITRLSASKTSH